MTTLDLGDLGMDQGAHLLIKHGLAEGRVLCVSGRHAALGVHLLAWCRSEGHGFETVEDADRGSTPSGPQTSRAARSFLVTPGPHHRARLSDAEPAGRCDAVVDEAPAGWGLAARGALVEKGTPLFAFPLRKKSLVWAEESRRLYAQAAAAQWDPATAIDWSAEFTLPDAVEDAVVQVMTYLVENETAALVMAAKFAAQVHPHFRESAQILAIQAADEARHVEVFTRRATLKRTVLGLSTVGGQTSLKTLLDEPDFALAQLLLSVLGEGSFLSLLWFLHEHAPDPITRAICKLSAQDEARHVAFGLAHLAEHVTAEPTLRARLAMAIERRHAMLAQTSGLNAEVFDALLLLAAGAFAPDAIREGWERVQLLQVEMDQGRRRRLMRLGFDADEAAGLSALHTRNFM